MSVMTGAPDGQLSPTRLACLTAALLMIDDARRQGLIDGVPWIDRVRYGRLLGKLLGQGVMPSEDDVLRAGVELMEEMGVLRG